MSGRTPELPLVSIGLPVHNAERHLSQALDSLLGQDYPNLELIVSDNASDDATQSICTEYAKKDDRLFYHRVDRNMGAVWNFTRVFDLSRGEYFMWAAFDDIRDPRYVSACVAKLESRPDAVLCCTDVVFIDEHGQKILDAPARNYGVHPIGRTARDRLRQVAQGEVGFAFYGLARRSVQAQTRRPVAAWGFDVIVLLELCLRGPVVLVPEPLFFYRRFQGKTQADLAVGLSGSAPQETVPVCWSCLTLELLRSISLAPVGRAEKLGLTVEFLLRFCVLNVPMVAGIRRDITSSIKREWSERRWRRLAVLLGVGVLVYPLHNRFTRWLYRLGRRLARTSTRVAARTRASR
jgi:glycosyltransferase involved in cell wall biosynthesis